ncbi:MAG: beta-class carbonic anhydrase [Promethearchaeota archaeon]
MNGKLEDINQIFVEGNKQYQWKILQEDESNQIDGKIPRYPILILTCMDPWIDVYRIFQLKPGDAFVLRNAGNTYTEDVLRSVLVAIHKYNIQYIVVLGHLDCGMKKLHVGNLIDKLTDSAIKRFMWSETNFYLGFQKFFKAFTDEIMNIKNQVQKFRKAREIPSNIKIMGMLYDPNTGWVFTDEELRRYSNYENFAKSYRKILQTKKLELVDYIEDNAEEIIGDDILQEVEELIDVSEHKENLPLVEDTKNQESIINNKLEDIPNETPILIANKIVSSGVHGNLIPKIKIPKIHVPKIKVHVPVIYKKSEED